MNDESTYRLVLVMVVKKSKPTWCKNSWLILFFIENILDECILKYNFNSITADTPGRVMMGGYI